MDVISEFKSSVIEAEDDTKITPFLRSVENGITFIHIRHSNIVLVAVTRKNSNATMILAFLYKLVQVFEDYFKKVNEESIRDNFVIIYELLDEMMDFGFPQFTESKILTSYITQDYHQSESSNLLPSAATNAVSWRNEGIKHMRNEVFLDVIENVNILISSTGSLLRCEILGKLVMKSYLSGMPNLKLGLNDRLQFESSNSNSNNNGKSIDLEDIKFHQCVRLSKFENDRSISFIPPDGTFELMSYRLNTQVKPPIWIDAIIEQHSTKIEYIVKARTQLKSKAIANNVKIFLPVLANVDTPKFKCTSGSFKYAPDRDLIIWSIKQFKAGREAVMRGTFLISKDHHSNDDGKQEKQASAASTTKRPITVEFEVPYFTISGLQVRFLKVVDKSGYAASPWVRYKLIAGDYQIRMS